MAARMNSAVIMNWRILWSSSGINLPPKIPPRILNINEQSVPLHIRRNAGNWLAPSVAAYSTSQTTSFGTAKTGQRAPQRIR
jgi:hypothetical protein